MSDPMLFTKLAISYNNKIKKLDIRHIPGMTRDVTDKFLTSQIPPDAPEWLHLHWMVQNEMRMEKQRNENKVSTLQDCNFQNQFVRERNSLSYEIHVQRSYLQYARKELTYEEVQEIEARYKELKNLYWKLFGCML